MAEIRVRPKPRSLAWLWALAALLVAALLAWYAVSHGLVQLRRGGSGAAADSVPALTPRS